MDSGNPAVLFYDPIGNAIDQIPASPYGVTETTAEYSIADGATNDFLTIVLRKIAGTYAPADFDTTFTADFVNFLNTVDSDEDTAGIQPYTDPNGNDIDTFLEAQWYGPAETWTKELPNYPYIEFWHRPR